MWVITGGRLGHKMQEFNELAAADNDLVLYPVHPSDLVERMKTRDRIERLEQAILEEVKAGADEFDGYGDNLQHYFIEGVYARELFIPAGQVVIGKLHLYPRICIISGGDVSFVTEFGAQRVRAPYTAVMSPGTKTSLVTHEDTTWTAIHGTHETDIEKLERTLVARNHAELDWQSKKMLGE